MAPEKKITILEFAPCADTLFHVRRDAVEGYESVGRGGITIRAGSRLRPSASATYAGGKATNVARVVDRLIETGDGASVALVVFRPDSPEGRYIHELQSGALARVRPRPVVVQGSTRFCINLSDPAAAPEEPVEFNLSPRVIWQPDSIDVVLDFVSRLETDLLLLAGNPPLIEPGRDAAVRLPAAVIETIGSRAGAVTADLTGPSLAGCLAGHRPPDVVKINREEYASVDQELWRAFGGVLVVTDARGCDVWQNGPGRPSTRVDGLDDIRVYSTVGAGDAAHAGFTVAYWVWGFEPLRAARYGQAAAAAAVTSVDGTRGLTKQAVDEFFARLEGRS